MTDKPITIFVSDASRKGYVWSAEDAVRLRRDHHLMGMLMGGIAQFKNQNVVNGLPMELGPDEVSLAHQNGWARLEPFSWHSQHIKLASSGRKRRIWDQYSAYYEYYEQLGAYGGRPCSRGQQEAEAHGSGASGLHAQDQLGITSTSGPVSGHAQISQQQPHLVQGGKGFQESSGNHAAIGEQQQQQQQQQQQLQQGDGEAAWQAALADGENFDLPISTADGARLQGRQTPASGKVTWTYPATEAERIRFAVFKDLHGRGFTLSGGPKFGSDLLAYPGDPSLYHAQFTVRLLDPRTLLNPMMLKSAARGSHAARKHLMLATAEVDENGCLAEPVQPFYTSVAPESGFGAKA